MTEFFSKSQDVEFLAYELKRILGDKIEINFFTLGQEVLTGKICLDDTKSLRFDGIDFNIKYSKDEFLRVNAGEIYVISSYIEKEQALKVLVDAISKIALRDNNYIGSPDAFYQIDNGGFYIPFYDWVWENKEEYLNELKNNTMFDDANIENLRIFNKEIEKEFQKLKVHN